MKYPRQLSSGANNTVIALSKSEVAKLYLSDTRSDIGSEAEKMKAANAVNDLVVKFIRLDYDESLQAEILVMERLYPIDYRAYEVERRELWLEVFEQELADLHKAGFVHRDLRRTSGRRIGPRLVFRSHPGDGNRSTADSVKSFTDRAFMVLGSDQWSTGQL